MPLHSFRSRPLRGALGLSAALALTAGQLPALAQSEGVGVTVNGQSLPLNPPPVERAGRVFVPLRGIFESLGATVVYANGTINATGRGRREISLHIGSTDATVAGQPATLDTPPFVVGATTYVPLRFVSQALGANVNYDGANRIVAITQNGGGGPVAMAPENNPPPEAPVHDVLRDLQPERGASVGSVRPTISANFNGRVDPNTIVLMLDGLDITNQSTRSTSGFVYAPPSPLQSAEHRVVAAGKLQDGTPFREQWAFSTGNEESHASLTLVAPGDGAGVGANFTIAGRTEPNARVHIVAGATAGQGRFFAFNAGNYTGDTVADGDGRFSQEVQLQTVPGATIGVTVVSTDPQSHASAQATETLHER